MELEEKARIIMKRDLMPFPNKQDKLEYTEQDVVLVASTLARELLQKIEQDIIYKEKEASFYTSAKQFRNGLSSALNSIHKIKQNE